MLSKFRIIYELDGCVSAYFLEASSKYNAKQRFLLRFPKVKILKIEEELEDVSDE